MQVLTRLFLALSSTRLGAWIMARTVLPVDRAVMALTKGRRTLSGAAAGLRIVVLMTTGARTGLPRLQPLLLIPAQGNNDSFALIASNWGQRRDPAWYFNLKANPRANCSIDGRKVECVSHEAAGAEYDMFWRQAVRLNPGYVSYSRRAGRRIPIMVMTPVNSGASKEEANGKRRNQALSSESS